MGFCGYLKQSTSVDILLGPFIDDTDGKTAETGLTIDVELSKNGQALADSESAAPTHDAAGTVDGYYNCVLGTTDSGTLGILAIVAHAAGFLPVHQTYQVVTAHWYDTMCSTDRLQVDVTQWLGQAVTADTNVPEVHVVGLDDAVLAAAKFAGDFLTSAKIADNAIAAEHLAAGAIDNATFAADVGSTAHGTNIIALACRKILEELNLDHLLKVAVSNRDTIPEVVDDTILANLMTKTDGDTSDFDHATDSLEAVRDAITIAQNDLDLCTGADGVTLATLQGLYAPNIVVPDAAGVAPTTAEIKTAIEADGSDLSSLMEALVNKLLITEVSGNAEVFNDAGVSQGTVAAAFTSVAGVTQRKRIHI